ncbi:MAG: DJ-1 family glyoxalase III [Lachnospiraceae bacterium]|mgnify:CR=1 FL=1|nr:DJ-1/PfpI family protein [Candidatus Fimimorpha excrementavium]
MSRVYAFLADGFEEVEAIAVIDVLRRAGAEVVTVSVMGRYEVRGSHSIDVRADALYEKCRVADGDLIFLPGGGLGTENLYNCRALKKDLHTYLEQGKRVAAICAAPSILGRYGLLEGKKATCYPGFEETLAGAQYTRQGVVTDGLITTARGMGFAVDLGLELTGLLFGKEKERDIKESIQHPDC